MATAGRNGKEKTDSVSAGGLINSAIPFHAQAAGGRNATAKILLHGITPHRPNTFQSFSVLQNGASYGEGTISACRRHETLSCG